MPSSPATLNAACTDIELDVEFSVPIAAGTLAGTLYVGARLAINLSGLPKSIAGDTLQVDTSSLGTIYDGEIVTLDLAAGSVIAASGGLPSAAYSGPVTNFSTIPEETNTIYPCVVLAPFQEFGDGTSVISEAQWFAHDIWKHPLTQPYVVAKVDLANNPAGNPPGYPVPPSMNDNAVGKQMANWIRYTQAQLGSTFIAAGKEVDCFIHFQNSGNSSTANTTSLLLNDGDKVTTSPTAANGLSAPWTLVGRTEMLARMSVTMPVVRSELDTHFARWPKAISADLEERKKVDRYCSTTAGDAVLPPSIASGRYTDHTNTVDGFSTFSQLLTAAVDIDGHAFTYDVNGNMYSNPANAKLFSWLLGTVDSRTIDFAHNFSVRSPARASFPGMPVGVYGLCSTTPAHPQPSDKAYLSGDYSTGEISHDFQCPICYPQDEQSFFDTGSSWADQCARYGISATLTNLQSDMARLYVARSKAMLSNAKAASFKPVIYWLMKPGHQVPFTLGGYPGGNGTYTVSVAELAEIMQHGKTIGIESFHWFCPDLTPAELSAMNTLLNAVFPPPAARAPMHRNLKVIKEVAQKAKTERVAIFGMGDSNWAKDDAGWDTGVNLALQSLGLKMWATPMYSGGDSSIFDGGLSDTDPGTGGVQHQGIAVGAGIGIGTAGDQTIAGGVSGNAVNIRYRANTGAGSLSAAVETAGTYRNGTVLPPANLLAHLNTTNLGDYAPLNYLYKPHAGTPNWWGGQATGIILDGGVNCPIDPRNSLIGKIWLGQTGGAGHPNDAIETGWFYQGVQVGATIGHASNGTDGTIAKRTHQVAANSARTLSDLQFRVPIGGVGPWFLPYMQIEDPSVTTGFSVSCWYALGSRSAYDVANAAINFPTSSWKKYFECLTDGMPADPYVVCVIALPGPNDLVETAKLGSAPSGTASSAVVAKYNLSQIISRAQAGWTACGYTLSHLRFLLEPHVPISDPDDATLIQYRAVCAELCDENPAVVAAIDRSLYITGSQLAANEGGATYANAGTDVNHLTPTSYAIVEALTWSAIMASSSGSSGSSLGTSLGIRL